MAEQKMNTLETKASKKYIGNIVIAELLIPYHWPATQRDKTISAAKLRSHFGCYQAAYIGDLSVKISNLKCRILMIINTFLTSQAFIYMYEKSIKRKAQKGHNPSTWEVFTNQVLDVHCPRIT